MRVHHRMWDTRREQVVAAASIERRNRGFYLDLCRRPAGIQRTQIGSQNQGRFRILSEIVIRIDLAPPVEWRWPSLYRFHKNRRRSVDSKLGFRREGAHKVFCEIDRSSNTKRLGDVTIIRVRHSGATRIHESRDYQATPKHSCVCVCLSTRACITRPENLRVDPPDNRIRHVWAQQPPP